MYLKNERRILGSVKYDQTRREGKKIAGKKRVVLVCHAISKDETLNISAILTRP